LNHRKDDYVMSEILFNLPISKYPALIQMEELNEIYGRIYKIFEGHSDQVKDWSMMSWAKLDVNMLKTEADEQEKMVRTLQRGLPHAEKYGPFRKLKETIQGFKNSLPLIEELRNPAVQERHWNRIIQETGKEETVGEINLKSITLQKVFELELHHFQDKVTDVCKEAVAEANNEEQVRIIDE
jgi:dynein heavy chain